MKPLAGLATLAAFALAGGLVLTGLVVLVLSVTDTGAYFVIEVVVLERVAGFGALAGFIAGVLQLWRRRAGSS